MSGFAEKHQQSQALLASDDPGAAAKAEQLWRSFLRGPDCAGDDCALSLSQLAVVVAERGRFKEAASLAWEGVEAATSPFAKFATWSEVTAVLYKGRRNDRALEAVALIDSLVEAHPETAEQYLPFVHIGRARLFFLAGRLDEAGGVSVRATTAADQRGSGRAEAYGIRSECLKALGDRDGAIISAMRGAAASTAAKCKSEALLILFHLHLEAEEYDEAKAFAIQMLALVPSWGRRVMLELNRAVTSLRTKAPEVATSLEATLAASGTLS